MKYRWLVTLPPVFLLGFFSGRDNAWAAIAMGSAFLIALAWSLEAEL